MNLEQQAAFQAQLNAMNMTRAQLATELEITPTMLSAVLSSSLLHPDDHWGALLDALDLEVVIRPIQAEESESINS